MIAVCGIAKPYDAEWMRFHAVPGRRVYLEKFVHEPSYTHLEGEAELRHNGPIWLLGSTPEPLSRSS